MSKVLILGAGTGGSIMANRLRKESRRNGLGFEITVVDPEPQHLYQPGLLFLPFGQTTLEKILKPKRRFIHKSVPIIQSPVASLDATA